MKFCNVRAEIQGSCLGAKRYFTFPFGFSEAKVFCCYLGLWRPLLMNISSKCMPHPSSFPIG